MSKQGIKLFELWPETIESLTREGLLLNSLGADGKPNTMAIGWMTGGVIWAKPILIVCVRPSRFTYTRLEQVAEFTVNVMPPDCAAAIQYCGTASGREVDKWAETRLTPAPAQKIRVPVIAEGLIHYECRVVHRNDVLPGQLAAEIKNSAYAGGDYHRIYSGEVLAAYAATDAQERLRRGLV